ncbi:hypothetical protein FLSA109164_07400 [Flavobacterium saliperosum]|uniref:Uncharacterized protein n=1 Tax=Flavobacterium saliperosum TaxID=329186 RepID=A0A1G4VLA4_9FLAO|nr:hypothetical protein SAMN02927925_01276 [Flavobacterium saliperosum]
MYRDFFYWFCFQKFYGLCFSPVPIAIGWSGIFFVFSSNKNGKDKKDIAENGNMDCRYLPSHSLQSNQSLVLATDEFLTVVATIFNRSFFFVFLFVETIGERKVYLALSPLHFAIRV